MGHIGSLLIWLGRVIWRDLRKLNSLGGNNFFVLGLYLLRGSGPFLPLLFGVVLFFPMTADPFLKIPPERFAMWPLSEAQRTLVRLACVALSPASWLAVGVLFVFASPRLALELVGCALVVHAALPRILPSIHPARLMGLVPRFPSSLGLLITKDVRQMLTTLDFYCAVILSAAAVAYRTLAPDPEPDAMFGMTVLVVLALSTCGQALFGRDGPEGVMRYRLLGIRGTTALLSKGLSYLLVISLLTAPLAPLAGLAGAFASLAVGHHVSVSRMIVQKRWSFTAASLIPHGIIQVVALAGAAATTYRETPMAAVWSALAYVVSLVIYGWLLDNQKRVRLNFSWI